MNFFTVCLIASSRHRAPSRWRTQQIRVLKVQCNRFVKHIQRSLLQAACFPECQSRIEKQRMHACIHAPTQADQWSAPPPPASSPPFAHLEMLLASNHTDHHCLSWMRTFKMSCLHCCSQAKVHGLKNSSQQSHLISCCQSKIEWGGVALCHHSTAQKPVLLQVWVLIKAFDPLWCYPS